jgi:F0F1-type ATP synthase delta subunit
MATLTEEQIKKLKEAMEKFYGEKQKELEAEAKANNKEKDDPK